jgi:hypothetical protein
MLEGHELGGKPQEIAGFYASAVHPKLAEKTDQVSPRFLLKLLDWIENAISLDEN